VGEQHVREDCNNLVPSAKDWISAFKSGDKPLWMTKTMKLEFVD